MGICGSKNDRIGHDDMLVPANLVDAQLQMLQQFSAFQDIEASEKQDIALALFSVEFQVNAELASQGDTQKEPRLILASEGKCEVFVNIDGVKSLVRTLEAPFYIGEGALLTGKVCMDRSLARRPRESTFPHDRHHRNRGRKDESLYP
jgi:hypothetical protein